MNQNINMVYVEVMRKSLEKKVELLTSLLEWNKKQEIGLLETALNYEEFDRIIAEKQRILEEIERLEQGFESSYDRVKDELKTNRFVYQKEILAMQQLIGQLTQLATQISLSEAKVKQLFQPKMNLEKQKVKQFNVNSRTANSYYKNMANQHMGQSYFLDKKK